MIPREKLLETLRRYWGYERFRPLQLETIEDVCAGRDTLVLMPTGGGKSVVYQVPALASEGVCVVVTPLIALMKDQIDRLRSRRILAESIHSGMSPRDIDRILDNCVYGSVKFLYIAPERIDSELFRTRFGKMRVSLLAVDEAHCISQWGYDFRPSYLRIARLRELQPDVPVLALTASATPEVAEDIMRRLKFREPHVRRMSFERANLSYVVRRTEDKHGQLLRIVGSVPGPGIVYVRTREKAETITAFLNEHGIAAGFYHGGMNYLMRSVRQDEWIRGTTRVMVATNAFGMGIDKADVRLVVHYDACDSLEAYYQEAGRAGRDGRPAYAVTLLSDDDASKAGRRMELDFPSKQTIRRVYEALFNYLGVAVGDGRGASFTFNVFDFAARFRFFVPTALQSIKILQQNGYMVLTDETDNPPRIRFIVQRDELYRIRVDRRELDHFITVLLRRYSGLFSDFVPIAEDELAHLTGYTAGQVRELLKKLWQLHIVKYIPGNRSPMLFLSEERLPADDVRISPESYTLRKEAAEKRLGAMLRYLNGDECRSIAIRRYFGEQEPSPCGICDRCRERRKSGLGSRRNVLGQRILELVENRPTDVKALVSNLGGDASTILDTVTSLLDNGEIIARSGIRTILVINKIDLTTPERLEELVGQWRGILPDAEIVRVTALNDVYIGGLFDRILAALPEGEPFYPKDALTDKTLRFFASEIIREKIFLNYEKEIPYSVEIAIEEYKEEPSIDRISATIYVARESQKGIVIGHRGERLKRVGTQAREELEQFLGKKVFLQLFVKVNDNWRNDDRQLRRFGYIEQ